MTMTIGDLPQDVRRALAMRATLELLGFELDHIFVGAGFTIVGGTAPPPPPPPPGQLWLAVTLSLTGDPGRADLVVVAGSVDRAWWDAPDTEAGIMAAWNALPFDARGFERRTYVSVVTMQLLVTDLIGRGICPPAVLERVGAERPHLAAELIKRGHLPKDN